MAPPSSGAPRYRSLAALQDGGADGGLSPHRPVAHGGAGGCGSRAALPAPLPLALVSDRPRAGDAGLHAEHRSRGTGEGAPPPATRSHGAAAPPAEPARPLPPARRAGLSRAGRATAARLGGAMAAGAPAHRRGSRHRRPPASMREPRLGLAGRHNVCGVSAVLLRSAVVCPILIGGGD